MTNVGRLRDIKHLRIDDNAVDDYSTDEDEGIVMTASFRASKSSSQVPTPRARD